MRPPLAYRMRPKTLENVIGQKHLLGENGFLRLCQRANRLVSIIFYGEAGVGKTTIAEAFANSFPDAHVIKLNAVTSNKKEMEDAIAESKMCAASIIIMDEVHRLNKDKQDILLPHLEDGSVILLGATTANPYIAINPAIRSRTHVLEVKRLSEDDIILGLKNALASEKGLNNEYQCEDDALCYIAHLSGGDLRFAMNYLEIAAISSLDKVIRKLNIKDILCVPNIKMDKSDDAHYDSVSALQKSIRGSDVDASLYYLARLCIAGDLESIERRLLVTAYEDIGLANPHAVNRTAIALESARKVGFPEAVIPLAFAVVDLALSPKSKSAANAMDKAMKLASEQSLDVMDYLRLTPVNVQEEDKYPYDRPDLWNKIQYLPNLLKNIKFYKPNTNSTYERALSENYHRLQETNRSANLRNLKKK